MHEASGAINSVRRARIPSMQPAILLVSPARSLMFRQARPETDGHVWCLPLCETFSHRVQARAAEKAQSCDGEHRAELDTVLERSVHQLCNCLLTFVIRAAGAR